MFRRPGNARLVSPALATVVAGVLCAIAASACNPVPKTGEEVLARSVAAHGGDRLTNWQTVQITGTVEMQDGIAYDAAFLLLARPPGQVRVEQDLTVDRGRAFYEYFLDGGVAWQRRNLIVSAADVGRMQRWLNHCYLVAHYATHATALELKPDAIATPPSLASAEGATAPPPPARPVWVVAGTIGEEAVELHIDKEDYRFLREVTPAFTRDFGEFKTFNGVLWPTLVIERTKTRQREVQTPFVYASVVYNLPIEDRAFLEDKPQGK